MNCLFKSLKCQAPKSPAADRTLTPSDRSPRTESIAWSPLTAGPYIVPVTRWVE
jgi:hypothetical protein